MGETVRESRTGGLRFQFHLVRRRYVAPGLEPVRLVRPEQQELQDPMPDTHVAETLRREVAHRLRLPADALQRRRIAEIPHFAFDGERRMVLTVPPAAAVRVTRTRHVDRRPGRASDRYSRAVGMLDAQPPAVERSRARAHP